VTPVWSVSAHQLEMNEGDEEERPAAHVIGATTDTNIQINATYSLEHPSHSSLLFSLSSFLSPLYYPTLSSLLLSSHLSPFLSLLSPTLSSSLLLSPLSSLLSFLLPPLLFSLLSPRSPTLPSLLSSSSLSSSLLSYNTLSSLLPPFLSPLLSPLSSSPPSSPLSSLLPSLLPHLLSLRAHRNRQCPPDAALGSAVGPGVRVGRRVVPGGGRRPAAEPERALPRVLAGGADLQ